MISEIEIADYWFKKKNSILKMIIGESHILFAVTRARIAPSGQNHREKFGIPNIFPMEIEQFYS